jgi:hypothetical protein
MSVLYDLEWRLADDTPVGSVDVVTTAVGSKVWKWG